eukprot:Sspe_Gene.82990::Locus_54417_Transcript_1_1_Confidence_1.000_Length_365::g.82990::m.82990
MPQMKVCVSGLTLCPHLEPRLKEQSLLCQSFPVSRGRSEVPPPPPPVTTSPPPRARCGCPIYLAFLPVLIPPFSLLLLAFRAFCPLPSPFPSPLHLSIT